MKKLLSYVTAFTLVLSSAFIISTIDVSAVVPGNLLVNSDFETSSAFGTMPSPLNSSPGWWSAAAFQKWFRNAPGSGTDIDSIIVDPQNSSNHIAKVMQNTLQGVTVEAGKTYLVTFSAKADYAFKRLRVSFYNVTGSNTSTNYEISYPVVMSSGTKTYMNGGTQVTDNIDCGFRPAWCDQVALDTTRWVTYKLQVRLDPAWAAATYGAIMFAADDYSATVGDPAHAAFYLDDVSVQESYSIVSSAEVVSGKTGGYITNASNIHAVSGQNVTLAAVAYSGSTFDGWYLNGSRVSTSTSYTFAASTNATYLAKFTNPQHAYTPDTVTSDDIIADDPNLMISYPHYGTPAFTEPNGQITAEVRAPSSYGTTGWSAWVENDYQKWDCTVGTVTYGSTNVYLGLKAGYKIPVTIPSSVSPELCSLVLKHSSGLTLRSPMSVNIVPELDTSFYAMDLTDTHMGWNNDARTDYDGTGCPTAWGLMCRALKVTGIRFLSHTGDVDLYPLQSRADGLKTMIIDKQLEYSGTTLPFVHAAGNHEYDAWVYPVQSIDTGTYYDENGNGVQDPGEFNGTGQFGGTDNDRFFGMRSALMPMGSFLLSKNDFLGHPKQAYWGDTTQRTAMVSAWNASASNYSFRVLLEHDYGSGTALFKSGSTPTASPYPSLEFKGHDHQWTVNQTSPYRVLSVGGGSWPAGSGALVKFDYSGSSWSSPAQSSWNSTTDRFQLVDNYGSRTTKINESYTSSNNGTVTSNSCTISNAINFNFYDGRVRFVMAPGNYNVTNGTKLSQYNSADGTKTIVLVKVNIPANGSVTTSISPVPTVTYLMSDSFNTYATGSAPTGWTVTNNGGTVTAEEVPTATEKSLKLYKSSGNTGYAAAEKAFTAQTSGVDRFDAWVMTPETTSQKYLMMRNAAGTQIPFKVTLDNGNIKINDSTTVQAFSANQWYHIVADLDMSTKTSHLYVNDVDKGSYSFYNTSATDLGSVMFSIHPNYLGTMYVNFVAVTK